MKALAALSVAVAAIGLSPAASAQTRTITEHSETASALICLLDHERKACGYHFVGSAKRPADTWLWWGPVKDFDLGDVVSATYAGTERPNYYTTRNLNGRSADVYDVKFEKAQRTFYIVPPGPDGKVRYIFIRNGAPDDEIMEYWASR
jgi:hypothetical protein